LSKEAQLDSEDNGFLKISLVWMLGLSIKCLYFMYKNKSRRKYSGNVVLTNQLQVRILSFPQFNWMLRVLVNTIKCWIISFFLHYVVKIFLVLALFFRSSWCYLYKKPHCLLQSKILFKVRVCPLCQQDLCKKQL
jgi:hypothetical protein